MQIFVRKGHVLAFNGDGTRNIDAEIEENMKIRRRKQRRRAGHQLNAQEPHRLRKGEKHASGKAKVVETNRRHKKAMRDAERGILAEAI